MDRMQQLIDEMEKLNNKVGHMSLCIELWPEMCEMCGVEMCGQVFTRASACDVESAVKDILSMMPQRRLMKGLII